MEEADREYWLDRELWTQVEACLLAYDENPSTYKFKPDPPQSPPVAFLSSRPYELREPDPLPWAKLYHLATVSMDAGTLLYVNTKRGREVRPPEFLPWAQGKGVTLPDWLAPPRPAAGATPDETQPSTAIVPDNKPMAKRKAPDIFVAALIRLIVEISKRAAENGMPFDVNEMPGIKADFRELAIKFDSTFNKAPSTFDDYLAGLLRFKPGTQKTPFYRELFPELFR